ncbi:MAG: hypothetical protein ACXQTO_05140 [Candidatus Syntropharchaeales archaeon]
MIDEKNTNEFDWYDKLNKISPLLTLSGIFIMVATLLVNIESEADTYLNWSKFYFFAGGLLGVVASFLFVVRAYFKDANTTPLKVIRNLFCFSITQNSLEVPPSLNFVDIAYRALILLFIVWIGAALFALMLSDPFGVFHYAFGLIMIMVCFIVVPYLCESFKECAFLKFIEKRNRLLNRLIFIGLLLSLGGVGYYLHRFFREQNNDKFYFDLLSPGLLKYVWVFSFLAGAFIYFFYLCRDRKEAQTLINKSQKSSLTKRRLNKCPMNQFPPER